MSKLKSVSVCLKQSLQVFSTMSKLFQGQLQIWTKHLAVQNTDATSSMSIPHCATFKHLFVIWAVSWILPHVRRRPAGRLTNTRWNWSEFDKFTNLSTQKLLRRRKICTMIVASCRGASAACLIGHHIHHYTKMPQPRADAAAVAAAAATPPHVPSMWLKN